MNDAAEPSATRVSIFGAPRSTPLKPEMKNSLLMTITISARTICAIAITSCFPSSHAGSGNLNIICPMERYISTARKPRDINSLRLSFGVSLSLSASSSSEYIEAASSPEPALPLPALLPLSLTGFALYPASLTALIILSGDAVPSTPMEFVRRFTEQTVTPSTFETAFSTLAEHAAQCIPDTLYLSIRYSFLIQHTKIYLQFPWFL